MELLCAICNETSVRRGFFCKACYDTYKEDILNHASWIKVCKSTEIARRRQEARAKNIIYLGDELDVDNNGRLVFRD